MEAINFAHVRAIHVHDWVFKISADLTNKRYCVVAYNWFTGDSLVQFANSKSDVNRLVNWIVKDE